jgi:hypothetical protein
VNSPAVGRAANFEVSSGFHVELVCLERQPQSLAVTSDSRVVRREHGGSEPIADGAAMHISAVAHSYETKCVSRRRHRCGNKYREMNPWRCVPSGVAFGSVGRTIARSTGENTRAGGFRSGDVRA